MVLLLPLVLAAKPALWLEVEPAPWPVVEPAPWPGVEPAPWPVVEPAPWLALLVRGVSVGPLILLEGVLSLGEMEEEKELVFGAGVGARAPSLGRC